MPLAGTWPLGTGDLSDAVCLLISTLIAANGKLFSSVPRGDPRWSTDICLQGLKRSPQFSYTALETCSGSWGERAGLSLNGNLTLPVLMWESTTTVVLQESLSDMPGLILTVLSPRRTFGIKLKITLSAMQDDEGRWMAGPWLPH